MFQERVSYKKRYTCIEMTTSVNKLIRWFFGSQTCNLARFPLGSHRSHLKFY